MDNQNAKIMNKTYYLFQKNKVACRPQTAMPCVLDMDEKEMICRDIASDKVREIVIDNVLHAAELPEEIQLPANYELMPLRSLLGRIEDDLFSELGKASHLLHWHRTNNFCGRCGGKTIQHPRERALLCQPCGTTYYPAISPCIIVLVHRNEQILLARSPRFPGAMYSTLAGFIEVGESAEETIHREIFEEVSVHVANIEYFKSQPWPFPGQLMLGFFAEYRQGELIIDNEEICDAGWYHINELPQIPSRKTIAGQLIREYIHRFGQ